MNLFSYRYILLAIAAITLLLPQYDEDLLILKDVMTNVSSSAPSDSFIVNVDISEDVELKLEQNLGVEPTIHIDPVYPENPMVKQVEDKLTSMYSNDNRITNIGKILRSN